jgi:SAM-dependent methyltransferase
VRPANLQALKLKGELTVRRICCVMVLMFCVAAHAQENDYQMSLIARFRFYNTARTIFAPVYPALAKQLIQDYSLGKGIAVDLGGAEGSLSVELARLSELTVYNVDIDPAAVRLCNLLTEQNKLTGRVLALEADATHLPLRDGLADLVVSRKSLFGWPDRIAGFREAYRILKPGGVAYMGGGFSRLLDAETLQRLVAWSEDKNRQKPDSLVDMPGDLLKQLRAFGITQARIIEGPTRFDWWLEMRKPAVADAGSVHGRD